MKSLPPSMRGRKRYIAFRIIAERSVDEKMLWDAMTKNLISIFGEAFAAEAGLKLEEFNGKEGIVRCNLKALEKVMIALTLIDRIGDENVALLTLAVSGTIKSCRKKLGVVM